VGDTETVFCAVHKPKKQRWQRAGKNTKTDSKRPNPLIADLEEEYTIAGKRSKKSKKKTNKWREKKEKISDKTPP